VEIVCYGLLPIDRPPSLSSRIIHVLLNSIDDHRHLSLCSFSRIIISVFAVVISFNLFRFDPDAYVYHDIDASY
jgi:hypothetical protein